MAYSSYKYFNVVDVAPFVKHVEINRPAKLNAFDTECVLHCRAHPRPPAHPPR